MFFIYIFNLELNSETIFLDFLEKIHRYKRQDFLDEWKCDSILH